MTPRTRSRALLLTAGLALGLAAVAPGQIRRQAPGDRLSYEPVEGQKLPDGRNPELLEQLRRLERPPDPWLFPPAEDLVHRRGQPPVVGRLQSLSAFAVVELGRMESGEGAVGEPETVRIPRDEIHFIFLDGNSFLSDPPLLPAAEDSVVTTGGEVVEGSVQIAGESVTVGARSLAASEVALIRLAGRESEAVTPAGREEESDDGSGQNADDAGSGGESSRPPPPAAAGGACWHGTVDYTTVTDYDTGHRVEAEVHWTLALEEVDRHRDAESALVGLEVVWGRYDVSYRDDYDDPRHFYRPAVYEVSGGIGHRGLFIQTYYYTTSRPPDELEPTALKHHQYQLQTPVFDNQRLGWHSWPFTHDGGEEWLDFPPPFPDSLHVGVLPTPFFLQQDGTRMRGGIETGYGGNRQVGSWDLVRVDRCPAQPVGPPRPTDGSGCQHAQLMIDSYREYLEEVGPLAERLAADLEASLGKLQGLAADLDFYSSSFQQAMILAGVGDVSMKILKTLGPARLAGGAPTPGLANGITWGFQMLKFMQDPVKWTTSKAFKPAARAYEVYQRLQILQAMANQDWDPALAYISENMEVLSGDDNPISRGARKFVDSARAVAPLLRKISLQMGEALQLQGDMQNARAQLEAWEGELEECEEEAE